MSLHAESREARGPGWEERRDQQAAAVDRWALRSGEWSALALARHVFGAATTGELTPWPDPAPLRGVLALRVPFRNLEDHRRREGVFLLLAARDEVVSQLPFLYVFEPAPAHPAESAGPPVSLPVPVQAPS